MTVYVPELFLTIIVWVTWAVIATFALMLAAALLNLAWMWGSNRWYESLGNRLKFMEAARWYFRADGENEHERFLDVMRVRDELYAENRELRAEVRRLAAQEPVRPVPEAETGGERGEG